MSKKNGVDNVDDVQWSDVASPAGVAFSALMAGEFEKARGLYVALIAEQKEPDAEVLHNYAQVLRRLGQSDEALVQYRRAIQRPDPQPATHFNIGNLLFERGNFAEAEKSFAEAVRCAPEMWQARMQLARCVVNLGRWMEARGHYAAVLRQEPENFSAWLEAGNICKRHGPAEQMLACYRRAVGSDPKRWAGQLSLALALEQTGEVDAAARHFYLALNCEDAKDGQEIYRRMGVGRLEVGNAAGAVDALAKAVALNGTDYDAMIQLAHALMRVDDSTAAFALLEQVGESEDPATLTRLAETMNRYNLWPQAEDILRRVVGKLPDDWAAHFNLGTHLIRSWRMEEGSDAVRRAQTLTSSPIPGASALLADAASRLGDTDLSMDLFRELGDQEGPQSAFRSSSAMAALYSDALSPQEVAKRHRELFEPLASDVVPRFANTPEPGRRLRIGYVTADLHHQHPVNLFLQPVLARHNASDLEVTVYYVGETADEQYSLAKSRVARWRDVAAFNDARLAETIMADGIDVLIDLMGHTSHNRRGVFARRAAPVQASFLGYPASTGIPNMDWIIADPIVAPESAADLYSERIARLPHCVFCFAPETNYPYPKFDSAHRERQLTFGCFNNIPKLTPFTIQMWANVLAAVPSSRLILKAPSFMDPGAMRTVADRFARAGVATERLEFRGPSGLDEMMQEYADVDIALDPYPYNGGTTTYQALWMGAPVVSLAGKSFSQRMGASILSTIDRPDWVAQDAQDYVRIATELARDREALLEIKKNFRSTMLAADGLQIDRYVRDLEQLFRSMWHDWCANTP